jgi:hypothetical protein
MPWRGDEQPAASEQVTARVLLILPVLLARKVPVRALTPGPMQGLGRLRWADGTTVLVASAEPGDLARVSMAVANGKAVTLAGWEPLLQGPLMRLAGVPGRGQPRLWLRGPDQPD